MQQSQKVDIGNGMNQKIFALCTLHSPRYIEGLKNVEENLNPLAWKTIKIQTSHSHAYSNVTLCTCIDTIKRDVPKEQFQI